jgi:hypothetical protein
MPFYPDKLKFLQQDINNICKKVGRGAAEITILAATKSANVEAANQAITAGIGLIGENKIQDAEKKFPSLLPVKRHFIGHLQANKVKNAVRLFDCIESVDSLKLAEKINLECQKLNKKMPILVEVNIASDPNKHGIAEGEISALMDEVQKLPFILCKGFMAIVPFFDDPENARIYFKKMSSVFKLYSEKFAEIDTLSMGMSHDYRVALEEGATEIRIGSYLFKNEI